MKTEFRHKNLDESFGGGRDIARASKRARVCPPPPPPPPTLPTLQSPALSHIISDSIIQAWWEGIEIEMIFSMFYYIYFFISPVQFEFRILFWILVVCWRALVKLTVVWFQTEASVFKTSTRQMCLSGYIGCWSEGLLGDVTTGV